MESNESDWCLFVVPPQNVVITPNDMALTAGDPTVLSCSSGSSNPVSTITWYKNNTEIRENVKETGTSLVEFGGTDTRSRYDEIYMYGLLSSCEIVEALRHCFLLLCQFYVCSNNFTIAYFALGFRTFSTH